WRILTEDLQRLYSGEELGSKGSSYRQWVESIKDYANTHAEEKDYWDNLLLNYDSGAIDTLLSKSGERNTVSIDFDKDLTEKLLKQSNKAYHTQINDILLTALGYALSDLTGNKSNYIVLEGHGREEIDAAIDINRTLGWFTTMYPVKLEISEDTGSSIKNTKEMLRAIPNKGIGYGAFIDYKNKFLPTVIFNYLGQFTSTRDNSLINNKSFWNIADEVIFSESVGVSADTKNHDYTYINVEGIILDNKLKFNIMSYLSGNDAKIFSSILKQKLTMIISELSSTNRTYLTESDIDYVIDQKYLDQIQSAREISDVYLANSLQQGFIFHNLNQGNIDDAYCVQIVWKYGVALDVEKFKKAWQCVQSKFSSMRLRFAWNFEIIQIIDKKQFLDWRYFDLEDEKNPHDELISIQARDRKEPFDLAKGNLFRIYLFKLSSLEYVCMLSNHHAILDGWSVPLILEYLHNAYSLLLKNKFILCEEDRSYKDAQKYLQLHNQDHKDYWLKHINRIDEKCHIGTISDKLIGIKGDDYRHVLDPKENSIIIDGELYWGLKKLCKEHGLTLHAILQYVWHKILHLYGKGNTTVVGTTVLGRSLPVNDMGESVGLYINTLPLIVNHDVLLKDGILGGIKSIQEDTNELNIKSHINLAGLQKSVERLFDNLIVYENYVDPIAPEHKVLFKASFVGEIEKLDYPLVVLLRDGTEELSFVLKYAGELFSADRVEEIFSLVNTVLKQIVKNVEGKSTAISFLSLAQEEELVGDVNATGVLSKEYSSVQSEFERQVELNPNALAVISDKGSLTYKDLNEYANKLANYLQSSYELKSEDPIAVFLDSSEDAIVAMLAILKLGCAYVPLSTHFPNSRIEYILKDTGAKIVLTNGALSEGISFLPGIQVLELDNEKSDEEIKKASSEKIQKDISVNDLAYIMYTSGTSGNPKGVMVEHKGIVSLVKDVDYIKITPRDRFIQLADVAFDATTFEVWGALLNGASLYIPANKMDLVSDVNLFRDFLKDKQISILWLTRTLFDQIFLLDEKIFKELSYLLVGGESLTRDLIFKLVSSNYKPKHVINGYGPTENTTFSCVLDITPEDIADKNSVPIGKPFSYRTAYILNEGLMPLPVGAIGELYVGGTGMARGYLNSPKLTEERFINNPFQSEKEKIRGLNNKLYRTGDLVRWLPDRKIEYVGRNDFQVKIRGYRIELGEIENVLNTFAGIKRSAVLAHEDVSGSKYLVGYYVSQAALNEDEIKEYIRKSLPDYMVPNILIHLEDLPLTANGKLDMRALPTPEINNANDYVAPRNELEKEVCSIWAEALGLKPEQV
ncbi:MAG: amino acid adenylation domain-containing protein, partial [Gammaproteobacteria bacterium]